jgi:T-complex protein 1 subunit beta
LLLCRVGCDCCALLHLRHHVSHSLSLPLRSFFPSPQGENARLSSIVGAIAIADLVKTTLGPKGLDKILQKMDPHDQSISVTNDGATILRSLFVDNAAAKVLVDISKVQDEQVGDGTTTVAVLCGELLREAENLMMNQRIHPQTICAGWRMALEVSQKALEQAMMQQQPDIIKDAANPSYRNQLLEIASTTLSSKLLTHEKEKFAALAVDAVLRLKGSGDLNHIQVIKMSGGSLHDSYLEEGFLLNKKIGVGQPRRITNAKILLANTSMDTDKIKMYGSRVKVDSLDRVADIEGAERDKMRSKVDKILAHECNVFINRQLIYNFPESIFAEHGVMAIEHADFDGIERLAAVTGGDVVSTFDHPELVTLGECAVVEEVRTNMNMATSRYDPHFLFLTRMFVGFSQVMIGEDKVLRLGGCKRGEACTIVLRGSSSHVLEEADRSLHDALAILVSTVQDQSRTIYGGGCTEVLMASAIDRVAEETPGKKSLAMAAFARALRQLPAILADNGGYDSAELVTQLRAAHAQGRSTHGLDLYKGTVADMRELGVRESYKSKWQALTSAAEAAEMILRVDDVIKAAPRRRDEHGY